MQKSNSSNQINEMNKYIDLEIVNNDTSGFFRETDLIFSETRTTPFLTNPKNYYVAVDNFEFLTPTSIPAFIPYIEIGQNDINRTVYKFGFSGTSFNGLPTAQRETNIIFESENGNASKPYLPLQDQDISSEYYHLSTIKNWIRIMNKNIFMLWTGTIASQQPFFQLNESSGLLTFNMLKSNYDAGYMMYVNAPLYNLLSGFSRYKNTAPSIINPSVSYTNIPSFTDYYYLMFPNGEKSTQTINGLTYIFDTTEINCNPTWNPVKSIDFKTAMLPIAKTKISPVKIFNSESNLTNASSDNSSPILTNFKIPISATNTYRNSINYEANGEFKFHDLEGDLPLSKIDIQVFWRDKFGGLHQVKIASGMSANLKLMFRRKDFNNTPALY